MSRALKRLNINGPSERRALYSLVRGPLVDLRCQKYSAEIWATRPFLELYPRDKADYYNYIFCNTFFFCYSRHTFYVSRICNNHIHDYFPNSAENWYPHIIKKEGNLLCTEKIYSMHASHWGRCLASTFSELAC